MNTRIRSSRKNRKQPNNRNRVRTKTNSDRRVIEKQRRKRTNNKGRKTNRRRTNNRRITNNRRRTNNRKRTNNRRRRTNNRRRVNDDDYQEGGDFFRKKKSEVEERVRAQTDIDNKREEQLVDRQEEERRLSNEKQAERSTKFLANQNAELSARQALDKAKLKLKDQSDIAGFNALTKQNLGYSASGLATELKQMQELQGDISPEKIKEVRDSKGFFGRIWKNIGDRGKRKKIYKKAQCNDKFCKDLANIIINNGYYHIFEGKHHPISAQELTAVTVFIGLPKNNPDGLSSHEQYMRDYQLILDYQEKEGDGKRWTFSQSYAAYEENIKSKREEARKLHSTKTAEELQAMVVSKGVLKESIEEFLNERLKALQIQNEYCLSN